MLGCKEEILNFQFFQCFYMQSFGLAQAVINVVAYLYKRLAAYVFTVQKLGKHAAVNRFDAFFNVFP